MTASLSTQIHRAVSALPLLAIAVAVAAGGHLPGATTPAAVLPAAPVDTTIAALAPQGVSSTLPGDALAIGDAPRSDCDVAARPVGALGLARMPGDIGSLAGRLRCAQ
jgi:hypothetical protein